jgi:hypothetical protein
MVSQINQYPHNFGITDITETPDRIWLALDGKLVTLSWHWISVDGFEECSNRRFKQSLTIKEKEPANAKLLGKLKEFIQTLDENEIMRETSNCIVKSGLKCIPEDWRKFYLI